MRLRYGGYGKGRGCKPRRRELQGTSSMGKCPKTRRGKAMLYAVTVSNGELTYEEAGGLVVRLGFNNGKRGLSESDKAKIQDAVKGKPRPSEEPSISSQQW